MLLGVAAAVETAGSSGPGPGPSPPRNAESLKGRDKDVSLRGWAERKEGEQQQEHSIHKFLISGGVTAGVLLGNTLSKRKRCSRGEDVCSKGSVGSLGSTNLERGSWQLGVDIVLLLTPKTGGACLVLGAFTL